MPPLSASVGIGFMYQAVPLFHSFVYLSGQTFLLQYLMDGWNSIDKTDREYLVALCDDLIRFWMSEVKVTPGSSMWWRRHPSIHAYIRVFRIADINSI